MNKSKLYIKITDKYIYTYNDKRVKKYESKYIKDGKVDNTHKLIIYLNSILNKSFIKKRYIFILDNLLCNSDIFVYRYVFENMGLLNYKIITDVDILKTHLNEDNLIIMNWSSSTNYCYLNNGEVVINRFNQNIINNLDKKYIITIGDEEIHFNTKTPVYNYEDRENVIFNFLKESQ